MGEHAPETHFHRLNNAFIRRMTLSFRLKDVPLHNYLRANASNLLCQVEVLRIDGQEAEVAYPLVEFLGVHLKPQICELFLVEHREDYVMLIAHNAFRGNVKHMVYELYRNTPAPDCIIPELFGIDVVESCAIETGIDPRSWIRKFIDRFEMAERGTDVVRSVTLLYNRSVASPLRHTDDRLGQLRHSDVPTPHNAFVKNWSQMKHLNWDITTNESTVAELFVFENVKSAKKIEAFMWTLEQARGRMHSLHYAFVLNVVDV